MCRTAEFLITSGIVGAGLAAGCAPGAAPARPASERLTGLRGEALDHALAALDSATAACATYADVRAQRNRRQFVSTRERQIAGPRDGTFLIENGRIAHAVKNLRRTNRRSSC